MRAFLYGTAWIDPTMEAPMTDTPPDVPKPSLELLIKLIKMSTSDNDAEALLFLRRANKEADKFGGWEDILRGKITVIGDPFGDLPRPRRSGPSDVHGGPTAPTPPRPAPPPPPQQPPRAPRTPPTPPRGAGNCSRCFGSGIFQFDSGKRDTCFACNGTGNKKPKYSPPKRGKVDATKLMDDM